MPLHTKAASGACDPSVAVGLVVADTDVDADIESVGLTVRVGVMETVSVVETVALGLMLALPLTLGLSLIVGVGVGLVAIGQP